MYREINVNNICRVLGSSIMETQGSSLFVGPVVHSVSRHEVTVIPRAAIVVSGGKIATVEHITDNVQLNKIKGKFKPNSITILKEGQFLIPGFIDTHLHAPQFPNVGLGYDKPLLDWLTTYTFPLESQFADLELAKRVYNLVVRNTLMCGTTTAAYFGTVHVDSCKALADIAHCMGQRALVGKVCMDTNCVPEMTEDTLQSVKDTENFIEQVLNMKSELVQPVVTPRFAVTCTETLMTQLAQLASKFNIHIQTHMSENKKEIEEVRKLFPSAKNYADVYDQTKLLTRKTLLAHCVHLDDSEVAVVRSRGCSVAHCPNSNICLQSGLCDVRRLLDAGVNVSLGTDVAGGCNHMMLDAIRSCINTSLVLSFTKPGYTHLSHHEAFYLATVGGAIALDMERKLGNFEAGKYFDALLIDTEFYPMQVHSKLTFGELFQKFIFTGDDRNIAKVYVNGKLANLRL